jgi:hypothetical protein
MRMDTNLIPAPQYAINLGAITFLGFNALISSQESLAAPVPHTVQDWNSTLMLLGYVAVFVWFVAQGFALFKYRGESNQSKLSRDYTEIETLKKEVANQAVLIATLSVENQRLRLLESSHNKLRDKFHLLLGVLNPVLKDMDVDFSRGGTMGKIMNAIDEEQPTGDGRT